MTSTAAGQVTIGAAAIVLAAALIGGVRALFAIRDNTAAVESLATSVARLADTDDNLALRVTEIEHWRIAHTAEHGARSP